MNSKDNKATEIHPFAPPQGEGQGKYSSRIIRMKAKPDGSQYFNIDDIKRSNIVGSKIAEERKKKGMNQSELCKELKRYGVEITPGSLSKWEKGNALPNSLQLMALCTIFGIEDVVPTFTGHKPVAAEYSPELSLKGRHLLNLIKDALVASNNYSPEYKPRFKEPEKMIDLPDYDQPAAAGTGCYTDETSYSIHSFPESTVPDGTDFVIRVSGNSMLPRYVDGQPLMIEQCRELDEGEIGVFMYEGNSYVKQYTEEEPDEDEIDEFTDSDGCVHPKVVLHSLNPDYDDIEIRSDRFYIVGRVLN